MASEIKIIKWDRESLIAMQDLAAAIKVSNHVNTTLINHFLDVSKTEFVKEMEGGEYAEDDELQYQKPPTN